MHELLCMRFSMMSAEPSTILGSPGRPGTEWRKCGVGLCSSKNVSNAWNHSPIHKGLMKEGMVQSIPEIWKLPEIRSKSTHPFLCGAPHLYSKGLRTAH